MNLEGNPKIEKNTVGNDKTNKKYSLTIFNNRNIKSVNLMEFKKNLITVGRNKNNDIVIDSPIVSNYHFYLNLQDGLLRIHDNHSKNGIFIDEVKCDNAFLKDGVILRIDNPKFPLNEGVLIIVNDGNTQNKWSEYDLINDKVTIIGRSKKCDIKLNRISISSKHAKIIRHNDGYYIEKYQDNCGIILNNNILKFPTKLKNKDIILIDNLKLFYNNGLIYYQSDSKSAGAKLDAIDIVKTVKVKGKKRDISQHVNFSAQPGEFIAFIGGSGAGKSTFLKCICGVSKPTSGKVLINGTDLFKNYEILKNQIGYVPQQDIVFDDLTLIDMLKYATNLRMPDDTTLKEKQERIKNVLEIVELTEKKDIMIRNLSGGQRKRASIAVELIADPNLFFLDEPTSGLDPGTERNIMLTLRKMADSGKTIILVTHNTLNLHLCDKIVFFGYGGKLCFDGEPNEALKFFNVTDFVDIYNKISTDTDYWYNKFNENKDVKLDNKGDFNKEENTTKFKNKKSFLNQLNTLFLRKMKTFINNKQQILLLFGQVPIIAYLISFVITKNLFYSYEETKAILFTIATAAIWLGLLNSIQEVCKERTILEKEYMADLRLSAYLGSKILYLIILSFFQALLFIGFLSFIIDVPENGVFKSWFFETTLISFISIFSASTLGLLVSVFSKDAASAMTMPTLLLVPQLLFSGMLFPLTGVVDKISNFILCRWTVEALGTVNDLNSLVSAVQEAIPGYVRIAEKYYIFTYEHLSRDLIIIMMMSLLQLLASYIILKQKLERK